MESDFIDDFIQEYKNQPCLWQASSLDFKNRKKRQEAYYKLIDVASKHGEHYNIERTKQKINNLRCAFRQQLKKFTESKNNKSGKEDTYCPKRRYFESLMFLLDEERQDRSKIEIKDIPKEGNENNNEYSDAFTMQSVQEPEDGSKEGVDGLNQSVEESSTTLQHRKDDNLHIEVQCDDDVSLIWPGTAPKPKDTIRQMSNTNPAEIEQRARTLSESSNTSSHTMRSENASKKIKVDCSAGDFEKLLSLACNKSKSKEIHEDNFSNFGKVVAHRLRCMESQQSLIAEKLIMDILVEGQMKLLSYPIRNVPYRQEGQAFVISGLNINGTTEAHIVRGQQYSTQTIQYNTGNGSQL